MAGVPHCPLCDGHLDALVERCPACSGDLRSLLRAAELPDRCFNEAVLAGRARQWNLAAERLAVTLTLRPDDVDGLVLLGKVRLRQGRREEALSAWKEALVLAPDREDARLAIARVEARRAHAVPQGKRARAAKRGQGGRR